MHRGNHYQYIHHIHVPCTHLLAVVIVWTLYSLEHIKVCPVRMWYVLICWVSPLVWCVVFTECECGGQMFCGGVTCVEDWSPWHILHVISLYAYTFSQNINFAALLKYKHKIYEIGAQNVANKETICHVSHCVRSSFFLASICITEHLQKPTRLPCKRDSHKYTYVHCN